jgi:enamine deaminase RidA (YjgF/YER057c/UK114 family)
MSENNRIEIRSNSPWEDIVGYSRAVRKGKMVWVSGTTSIKDGKIHAANDPYAQTLQCLQIIQDAILAANGKISDIVRTRIFVTNIEDWESIGRAHAAFFGATKPACTMVQISKLIDPSLCVEIEAEAFLD